MGDLAACIYRTTPDSRLGQSHAWLAEKSAEDAAIILHDHRLKIMRDIHQNFTSENAPATLVAPLVRLLTCGACTFTRVNVRLVCHS